ncbi:MAG TPA: hypothetical protein ENH65_09210 [Candidatus Aminicenantes bacterium]|nr:hypothetical protein [Candidatus Aminicenantes bacterium]
MARRRTGNTINSLFQGIAQGLQLGQQIKGRRSQRELQERGLGLQERGLEIREGQLTLDEQKALEAQQFRDQFFKAISGLGGQGLPSLGAAPAPTQQLPQQQPGILGPLVPIQPATLGAVTTPSIQPRVPSQIQERPSAPPISEITDVPTTGFVEPPLQTGPPLIRGGPEQVPFDTTTFGREVPQPIQSTIVTPTVVPPPPQVKGPQPVEPDVRGQQLASIQDFISQLDVVRIDSPTTVTLTIPGGGSISRTVGKNATLGQKFIRFNNEVSKAFPRITAADKARLLANSPMRNSKEAKALFDREFNKAVNQGLRIKEGIFRQDNRKRPTTAERNALLAESVNNEVDRFNGFVSKRHEKLFQEGDVDAFELSEAVQAELQQTFRSPEEFAQGMRDDPKGTAAVVGSAIQKVQKRKVEAAAQQGVAVAEAKIKAGLKLPVDPNDLIKIINPKTFAPFKAGTNYKTILEADGVVVTAGMRTALANINSSLDNVKIITELAKKLFTDDDLIDRIIQAGPNAIQQITQTNPDAILYESTVTAVTRTIARAFGEARITDFDAEDFRKSFPKLLPGRGETFVVPDSKALADKKLSQLARIIDNSRRRIIGIPPITNTALTPAEEAELEALEKELGR